MRRPENHGVRRRRDLDLRARQGGRRPRRDPAAHACFAGQEGNQFYQAYQDPMEPSVFHLFEIYDDEDAYAAHGASEHFAQFGLGQAIPVLTDRERAFYETIG